MNRPNPGEYFISTRDTFCLMLDDYCYKDFSLMGGFSLCYVEGSTDFSKKRDATMEEIDYRHANFPHIRHHHLPKVKDTEFSITLEHGHDMKDGLRLLEAAYIEHVYILSKYNQHKAARMLGISRGTLRRKLKQYYGEKYIDASKK